MSSSFVIASLYEVVEGRISTWDGSTIMKTLYKYIDTQKRARASESLRRYVERREWTKTLERREMADRSGIIARNTFGRLVVLSALLTLWYRFWDERKIILGAAEGVFDVACHGRFCNRPDPDSCRQILTGS